MRGAGFRERELPHHIVSPRQLPKSITIQNRSGAAAIELPSQPHLVPRSNTPERRVQNMATRRVRQQ